MSDAITTSYIQSALQTLLFVNDSLEKTQKATSSGYKINSPADNASYWSVANSMTSDKNILSSVSDALSLGTSKVDAAYSAVSSSIDVVNQIISQLATAKEDGVNKATVNGTLSDLKSSLTSLIRSASFGSDNWLYNTSDAPAGQKSVPVYFQRNVAGAVSLSYASFDASASTLIDTADASRGLLTGDIDASTLSGDTSSTPPRNYYLIDAGSTAPATGSPIALTDSTTPADIDDMVSVMNVIRTRLTTMGSTLGTMSNRIDAQGSFISGLSDVFDKSVSHLIDADMEEESTKLSAYQAQQQLSSQILGMANTHLQSLSTLFR
ncbi:flagellin [Neorhizobium lilium]|nr:flagellin [Neorhizobium lilium]